tara:strand:+ start:591 stop:1532 length:942 start_codon:yes stop_codon:yes gene_type:complete
MEQLSLFPLDADPANDVSRTSRSDQRLRCSTPDTSFGTALPSHEKARLLDQFYTCNEVAKELFDWFSGQFAEHDLGSSNAPVFMEPSAGEGAFLRLLPPGSLAFDIDPQGPGIVEADFLRLPLRRSGHLVVIGNPPFGKNASLAIRFFNHAARAASVIAFIVPLTFQKVSVQNRLDLRLHMLAETPVPKDSFMFEGKRKHVPATFQIWVRKPVIRQKIVLPKTHAEFQFLEPADTHEADFAMQRVGAAAGRVHHDLKAKPSAHYFLKAAPGIEDLEAVMRALDFQSLAKRTSGKPSLAKTEVVQLYTQKRRAI